VPLAADVAGGGVMTIGWRVSIGIRVAVAAAAATGGAPPCAPRGVAVSSAREGVVSLATTQAVPVLMVASIPAKRSQTRLCRDKTSGGEGGIRTHEALPPTRFPGERPRPLGDLSRRRTQLAFYGQAQPPGKTQTGIILAAQRGGSR
jgi:hypothetical protein